VHRFLQAPDAQADAERGADHLPPATGLGHPPSATGELTRRHRDPEPVVRGQASHEAPPSSSWTSAGHAGECTRRLPAPTSATAGRILAIFWTECSQGRSIELYGSG
jgi:hypothetical protein